MMAHQEGEYQGSGVTVEGISNLSGRKNNCGEFEGHEP